MPRTRRLNPAALLDERLAKLPPAARLLLAYLPCLADREGRLEDRPDRIRAQVFPYDTQTDAPALLHQLTAGGWLTRYHAQGQDLLQLPTWHADQRPHQHEPASHLPPPGEPLVNQRQTFGQPKASQRSTNGSLDLDLVLDPDLLPAAAALPAQVSSPPPPPPAPTPNPWPATTAELRAHFPTDDAFLHQLTAAARQADPLVTDDELAAAVAATWRTGQHSAGLWLHTVPHYLTLQQTAQRIPPARATHATGADTPAHNATRQRDADDRADDLRRIAHARRA